jgi:DNA-binding transcriptional LysR family regulator
VFAVPLRSKSPRAKAETSAKKGSPIQVPLAVADLRFLDLMTFLVVRRRGSVSAAARELKVTPSQVSTTITRLERIVGVKLFARSARGLVLDEAGEALAPTIEETVERVRLLSRPKEASAPRVTLAAPPYLLARCLSCIVNCRPSLRLRVLEFPPALLRAYASQNVFDVAILPSAPERITDPWVGTCIGELASGLFTTPATAQRLGPQPIDPKRLDAVPFISPVARPNGLFATIGDDCPLPLAGRSPGHEAQSIAVALAIAAHTGQLVFGPRLAAADYLASGALVEVAVKDWNVREPLVLACNRDRVLASFQTALVQTLRAVLN